MADGQTTIIRSLVETLRLPLVVTLDGHSYLDAEIYCALMREAAYEIEYLRSLAGVVSKGESFDEIKRQAKA